MESIALRKLEDRQEAKPEYADDRELARRCASGDERAFRIVFEAHEPRLRKLICRNVRSREDAEEISVATFLRFWRSAHRYQGSSSLKAYLTSIALNLCRDAGRKRIANETPNYDLATPSPSPPEEHPWAERIRQGLLCLEAPDRELLSLYYLQEWDYDEMCDALGITYDVLRTRLVRARKRLRLIVEERND